MDLVKDVKDLIGASTDTGAVLGLGPFTDVPTLIGALLASLTGNARIGQIASDVYRADGDLVATTCYDVAETARRNFEPGGPAASLLFARGIHAIIAHRVAHALWTGGDTHLALAIKSTCGRAFGTDIHPAAQIGAGLWLDHGLGFVMGETSVIGPDVSIWHNVTLGSTLNDSGPFRHPCIGRGAVIGAGAILLGGITIGEGANIGAGAIVVQDVAARALITGTKAQARGTARISFAKTQAGS
jgi:serine O-acetyltransferase